MFFLGGKILACLDPDPDSQPLWIRSQSRSGFETLFFLTLSFFIIIPFILMEWIATFKISWIRTQIASEVGTVRYLILYCIILCADYVPDCLDAPAQHEKRAVDIPCLLLPIGRREGTLPLYIEQGTFTFRCYSFEIMTNKKLPVPVGSRNFSDFSYIVSWHKNHLFLFPFPSFSSSNNESTCSHIDMSFKASSQNRNFSLLCKCNKLFLAHD